MRIEDHRRFSIHDLKRLGILRDGFNGSMDWTENGERVSTIGLYVCLSSVHPFVQLHYTMTHSGEMITDRVKLHYLKSNLPNYAGGYWVFICPATGNPCRVLYLDSGHFKSRKALPPGTIYRCQSYSVYFRIIGRLFDYEDAVAELNDILLKPFRKEVYQGKPTRTAKRLMGKENRLERALRGWLARR